MKSLKPRPSPSLQHRPSPENGSLNYMEEWISFKILTRFLHGKTTPPQRGASKARLRGALWARIKTVLGNFWIPWKKLYSASTKNVIGSGSWLSSFALYYRAGAFFGRPWRALRSWAGPSHQVWCVIPLCRHLLAPTVQKRTLAKTGALHQRSRQIEEPERTSVAQQGFLISQQQNRCEALGAPTKKAFVCRFNQLCVVLASRWEINFRNTGLQPKSCLIYQQIWT
jgi:hypothetical protein